MAKNEIRTYNPRQEFAVERVYQKLTEGIEQLCAEEAVDGLLNGADMLRQGISQVIERVYQGAEQKQAVVVGDRTDAWQKAAEHVKAAVTQAVATGDYDNVEKKLREATHATIAAKEAVGKMKYIKQRGQTPYNAQKEMSEYVRELEEFARQDKPRLLTGEVLPRGAQCKQNS